jgi:hypothetical protein
MYTMNEQQQMEERLWNYIDGLQNAADRSAVEQLIATNQDWKNRYHALLEFSRLLNSAELEVPSLRFSKNVMEDIARLQVAPATGSYINKKIIWGIGGFFLVMLIGFLVYGLSQISWASSETSSTLLPQYHFTRKLDWSKLLNNSYTNIFMMINVVLGLVLLDMYLQRKRDGARQQQA